MNTGGVNRDGAGLGGRSRSPKKSAAKRGGRVGVSLDLGGRSRSLKKAAAKRGGSVRVSLDLGGRSRSPRKAAAQRAGGVGLRLGGWSRSPKIAAAKRGGGVGIGVGGRCRHPKKAAAKREGGVGVGLGGQSTSPETAAGPNGAGLSEEEFLELVEGHCSNNPICAEIQEAEARVLSMTSFTLDIIRGSDPMLGTDHSDEEELPRERDEDYWDDRIAAGVSAMASYLYGHEDKNDNAD